MKMKMKECQIYQNIFQGGYTLGWEFGVKIISAKKNEQTSQITVIKPRKNNLLNI